MVHGVGSILATQMILRLAGSLFYMIGSSMAGAAAVWIFASNQMRAAFWATVCLFQALFTADAALGLRMLLAEAGREFFIAHDFYTSRQFPQTIASIVVATVTLVFLVIVILWKHKRNRLGPGSKLAIIGTAASLSLFLFAIISLHLIDKIMDWPSRIVNVGSLIRSMAILVVIAGSILAIHDDFIVQKERRALKRRNLI